MTDDNNPPAPGLADALPGDAWKSIPNMPAQGMPKLYATNRSADKVWLWVRFPNQCIAIDFDPDNAENIGHGLIEMAKLVRLDQPPQIEVVEPTLLGPSGERLL